MAVKAWRSITSAGLATSNTSAALQARTTSTTMFYRVQGNALLSTSPDAARTLIWGTLDNPKIQLRRDIYGAGGAHRLRADIFETGDAQYTLLFDYPIGGIDPDDWYVILGTYTKASPTTLSSFALRLYDDEWTLIASDSVPGLNANEVLVSNHADHGRLQLRYEWQPVVDAAGLLAGAHTILDGDPVAHEDLLTGYFFVEGDEEANSVEGMPDIVFGGVLNTAYAFDDGEWGEGDDDEPVELTPEDLTQAQTLDESALAQVHILAPEALEQGHDLTEPALLQHHLLAPEAVVQDHELTEPELTQSHLVLTPEAIEQTHELTEPALVVAAIELEPEDIVQVQTLDESALLQVHELAPEDLAQSQDLDPTALSILIELAPEDLAQSQDIESPLLFLSHAVLVPESLVQGHDLRTTSVLVILSDDLPVLSRAVTREVAPFGVGAEASFTNIYFTVRANTSGHLTLTPIVDGALKPHASRVITFESDGTVDFSRRYEIALYEPQSSGSGTVGRKSLRGTFFRLDIRLRRLGDGGQVNLGGFELEAERVTLTHPQQMFHMERAVPQRLPSAGLTYFFGLNGDNRILAYGEGPLDAAEPIPLHARSRHTAPMGPGVDVVFTQVSIPLYRHNLVPVTLVLTPIVDELPQPEHVIELPATELPVREVRHVDLYRPLLDQSTGEEVGRQAPRGCWWRMDIDGLQGVPDGTIRIGQVELEVERMTESQEHR